MDIVSKGGEEHFINLSLNEINGLQICPQSWITVSRTWAAGWMVASKPGRYIKIQLISVSYAFSGCCVKTGRLYQNITVFRGNCPLNHSFWVSYTFCECLPGLLWTELEIDSSVSLCLRSSRRMFQCFVWRSIQLSTFARMARRRISSGFVVLWFSSRGFHLGIFAAPRRTRAIGEKAAFFSSFKVLQEYMWHIVYWLKHLFVCLRELLI